MRCVLSRRTLRYRERRGLFTCSRAVASPRVRERFDSLVAQWKRGEGGAYGVAVAHAGLRDVDEAFAWLDKAIEEAARKAGLLKKPTPTAASPSSAPMPAVPPGWSIKVKP